MSQTKRDLIAFPCGDDCLLLHAFRVGADDAGVVEAAFDVALTPGDFARISIKTFVCSGPAVTQAAIEETREIDQCQEAKGKTAYLDFRIPAEPDRPQMTMTVKPAASVEPERLSPSGARPRGRAR